MLTVCGLELLGRHHSGIDDCNNIARIIQHLVSKGAEFNEKVCINV